MSYSRSNSVTLTVQQERFAYSSTRNTEPEVFTFERIPTQATAVRSYVPIRPKKRATRVMYPAKVRMHLPPPEKKSQAKRWLVILCLVVLWQIYTEEPCLEAENAVTSSDCQSFPLAQRLTDFTNAGSDDLLAATQSSCHGEQSSSNDQQQIFQSTTCPTATPMVESEASSHSYEQSAGKSYMVALLVYHRLNNDS